MVFTKLGDSRRITVKRVSFSTKVFMNFRRFFVYVNRVGMRGYCGVLRVGDYVTAAAIIRFNLKKIKTFSLFYLFPEDFESPLHRDRVTLVENPTQ